MDSKERLRLQKLYAGMPEKQLVQMLLEGEKDFQKEAYSLLLQEASRRRISDKVEKIRRVFKRRENVSQEQEEAKDFVPLFETNDYIEMIFLRSILGGSGITCVVENESSRHLLRKISRIRSKPYILNVEAEKLEQAKEILEDFKKRQAG
jgi:hypothetical protein